MYAFNIYFDNITYYIIEINNNTITILFKDESLLSNQFVFSREISQHTHIYVLFVYNTIIFCMPAENKSFAISRCAHEL